MKRIDNIWINDKAYIWMLVITVVNLIVWQIPEGLIWESKFLLRTCLFLFTLIAIRFSSLGTTGKIVGYSIASTLEILSIVMLWRETYWLMLLYTFLTTGYMIFIITLVVNQIFAGDTINVPKILGGVATYILIGNLWATLYITIYIIHPEAFQYGGNLLREDEALGHLSYFSFVTLTTIGYGDIVAVSSVPRILVMLEGLIGQLFPAIFIAKLVALQIEHSKK